MPVGVGPPRKTNVPESSIAGRAALRRASRRVAHEGDLSVPNEDARRGAPDSSADA